MPISRTPDSSIFPVWSTEESASSVTRYSSLPTPARMRTQSLFGIPLKSALTGETVSDDTLQSYIDQATSELEHTLDMYITPVHFTEKHDYIRDMFAYSFAYVKLNHPNIINVDSVQISFNNDTVTAAAVTFPLEHVHVMPQEGAIQLVPAFGTSLSGFLLSAFSGVQYHAFQNALTNNWPGAIRVGYWAGFPEDKVPAAVSGLIERMAAYKFLSSLGPLLFPHNSVSIGIDGVSQSTGTMGPGYLRQRMEELEKMIQQETDALRGYYQRRVLVDFI